jgi:hypothetical protein
MNQLLESVKGQQPEKYHACRGAARFLKLKAERKKPRKTGA